MEKLTLRKADQHDLVSLTTLSDQVFSMEADRWMLEGGTDANVQPPGYADQEMMMYMLEHLEVVCLELDGEMVGGAVLTFPARGYVRIDRIFIAVSHQGKGWGKQAMKLLEERYPDCFRWQLETSVRQVPNRYFYQACGYELVFETEDELYFEKKQEMNKPSGQIVDRDLSERELISIKAENVNVTDANLQRFSVSNANLRKSRFQNVNMSDSLLADSTIHNASFWYAGLKNSTFRACDFTNVKLTGCEIEGMEIDGVSVEKMISVFKKENQHALSKEN
ncbi:GNAT family N-acetyltransferase [Jeotgalibacillus sp. R-1-5s-1]|uniref:GNAT family N-acetyltransferase n=1 Tax=Jeotgalibacillus sp. R-1-5s-1 TaxID=2555897 RepID=UPI00141B7EA4|nr:GNAT family N-acetyltransferase [Jeotgalibacillus sp. R-1-5s-1]